MPDPITSADAARAICAAPFIALPPARAGAPGRLAPLGIVHRVAPSSGEVVLCAGKIEARGADLARCVVVNAPAGWYGVAHAALIVVQAPAVAGHPLVYVGSVEELAAAPAAALALLG